MSTKVTGYIVLISVIIAAAFLTAGCTSSSGTSDRATPTAQASASPTAAATPTPAPTATPTPIPSQVLSGTGNQATEKFHLEAGLATFKCINTDNSQYAMNFIAQLLNSNGNLESIVANDIGTSDVSSVTNIPKAGDYILDIMSTGSWTITVEQPRLTTAQSIPATLSGSKSQVSEPFYLKKGLTRFESSNVDNGQFAGNFIVWLVDKNGNDDALVANDIGTKDSSKVVTVTQEGVYYLSVTSGGDWEITVKSA